MFYNNLYNNNNSQRSNQKIQCCSNQEKIKINKRIDIDSNTYTIPSDNILQYFELTYIAQVPTTIFLPIINEYNEDININIINNSSGIVTVKTQNNELLFNSLYIPKDGSTNTNLIPNKFCKFIINKKNKIFSFILIIT